MKQGVRVIAKKNDFRYFNQNSYIKYVVFPLFWGIFNYSCSEDARTVASTYKYIKPQFDNIQLNETSDTISFSLNEHTYNAIKSFNIFTKDHQEYISFYDERSQSVNIYHFYTQQLIKKIRLKKCLKSKSFFKTTVYCKNFDSIFVNNLTTLYLIDSAGIIKNTISFLKSPSNAWAIFESTCPLIIRGNKACIGVRPNVEETSLKSLKAWKVLYEFDLQKNKAILCYHLPKIYQNNLYGFYFLDYSYCYNNKGNFVFSFPADTTIYETNLTDYHLAYYAKSRFQTSDIAPISKEYLKGSDLGYKQYKLRDSYGPIFFDPYRKRYLRLAKQRISENEFINRSQNRKESIIFLNEDFKIIGETEKIANISFSTLFFTSNGNMYTRINAKDEYALHFVRLEYIEKEAGPVQLTKN